MRNSKIAKITLVGLLISTSIGMISIMLTFNLNVEDPLPIYEPFDYGPRIRSTIYPIISKDYSELQSSSYVPDELSYYDIGDILDWPVLDDKEGYYFLDSYELRAFGEVSEIWVQIDLSYPDGDTRSDPIITEDQITYLLTEFEVTIYPTTVEYFGQPDSHFGDPDGGYYQEDGRNVILISNIRDELYYDRTYPYYIVGYYSSQLENEYDRNIISIDSHDWENRVGDDVERPNLYEGTIAHEYQHLIHDDYNPDDDIFMNEGCSMYAEPLCGYPIAAGDIKAYLATPDNSLTEWADQGDINILADSQQDVYYRNLTSWNEEELINLRDRSGALINIEDKHLSRLDRVGERSAQKALDNLFAVKEIPLAKFVGGFDLENIGETLAEKVVNAGYDTLEKIRNATVHDLTRVELFASITANQFYSEFHALYSEMEQTLSTNKITTRRRKMGSNKLAGLTFCFTGKLETMTRNEASDLVSEHGGASKSGVVKDLSYLVTNSQEKTSKYLKAQEQGTKIITEEEFLAMIE